MAKRKQVMRGQKQRKEKSVILIGTEGKNKTEQQYFRALSQATSNNFSLKFAKGNSTDPIGIVEDVIKDSEKNCTDPGDISFAVFDTDANPEKQALINEAVDIAKKNFVEVITSTPCFEVWFLQHFGYSTHALRTGNEAVEALRKVMPDYEKNRNPYEVIKENTRNAVSRAKTLEKYHDEQGRKKYEISRNPSTLVYIIVEMFLDDVSC